MTALLIALLIALALSVLLWSLCRMAARNAGVTVPDDDGFGGNYK